MPDSKQGQVNLYTTSFHGYHTERTLWTLLESNKNWDFSFKTENSLHTDFRT